MKKRLEVTIGELLKQAEAKLRHANIEEKNSKAKRILAGILGKPKEFLLMYDNQVIPQEVQESYQEAIEKLAKGTPLQYITGFQEFMGLTFQVTPDVLIPQPDTEVLVEEVLAVLQAIPIKQQKLATQKETEVTPKKHILDMCTGSGAIAISLAKYLPGMEVTGADISLAALSVAKENAKKNRVDVTWVQSDMFENIKEKYDIIVSNPPYIATKVIATLPQEVQCEPRLALDGGKDGLYFYEVLASTAHKFLKEKGMLALEIGFDQAVAVRRILEKTEKYEEIKVKQDLSKNDRVILAKLKEA